MPERFGQAFWPGVNGFVSCSYTTSQGISPGIASLEIPEQDVSKIAGFGTLVITDGFGTITLPRCRLQAVDFLRDGARRIVLQIADRRWMWRYGYITGNWNVIDPYPDPNLFPPGEFVVAGGPFAPGTYRPAHLLMADCLAAMNEGNPPLINPAPAVAIPTRWEEEVPAQGLAGVCDAVGFRVCLQHSLDRVLVAPAGVGDPLPDNLPIVSESPAVTLPARPATIQLIGGETIYNDLVPLEPCGQEPTGEIRHIDDLSYRPAAGWGQCSVQSFWEARATAELTQQEARELAAKCIWRMFRVKMVDTVSGLAPGPNIVGYGQVNDRKQIVLLPQVHWATKQTNGQPDTSPPYVMGSIYAPKLEGALAAAINTLFGNTDPTSGVKLPRSPQIDGARGLVVFDRQCYKWAVANGVGTFSPPELYLYTGMHIRGVVGQKPEKFFRGGATGGLELGCPPEVLRHPELFGVISGVRRNVDRTIATVNDNLDQIVPAADYYLERAAARYEVTGATSRTYAGIHAIDLNGAVSQVSWRVGGGQPATTTASLNTEHDPYTSPYPERRRREQLQAFNGKAVAKERQAAGGGGDFGGSANAPPPGYVNGIPPGA